MLKAACTMVTLMALSGCAPLTTGAETAAQLPRKAVEGTADLFEFIFTRPEYVAEAIEISRSSQCRTVGREPSLEVFTDAAAVTAWEAARGIQLAPREGALPPGTYAVAEMGERNSGGYSLVISRQAGIKDGELYLKASFLVPGNAAMATQALTSPCSLILLPQRSYSRVLLVDQANKVRASATLPAVAAAPQS